ncbi:MAG: hypothetical protein OEV92_09405 [Nitrospinota bacterium]|nr:hypothetical protein [Nitrospinota bacterium]
MNMVIYYKTQNQAPRCDLLNAIDMICLELVLVSILAAGESNQVDLIVVPDSDFVNAETHRKNMNLASLSEFGKFSQEFLTSGHRIKKGKGTVIGARIFTTYGDIHPESSKFLKLSLHIPFKLKNDGGSFDISSESGAIGFISCGFPGISTWGNCFGYIRDGTVEYKPKSRHKWFIKIHANADMYILGRRGMNNDCDLKTYEYDGIFKEVKTGELDYWQGKDGGDFYKEVVPSKYQREDVHAQ